MITDIIEGSFRRYIIVCEYMQIDPSTVYDSRFIKERAESILSQWGAGDDPISGKKIRKEIAWIYDQYDYLTKSGLLGHDYAGRSAELIRRGKLTLHEGTVNEGYVKKELRHENYDVYANARTKMVLFSIIIAAAIIGTAFLLSVIR
jgi:hypothetical protein